MVTKKKEEEVIQSSSSPPIIQQKIDLAKFSEIMVTIVNTVNSLKEQARTFEYRVKAMELQLAEAERSTVEYRIKALEFQLAETERRTVGYEKLLESIKKD